MMSEATFLFGNDLYRAYQINDCNVLIVRRMYDLSDFEDVVEDGDQMENFIRAAVTFIGGTVEIDYRIVTAVVHDDRQWSRGLADHQFSTTNDNWQTSIPLVQRTNTMAEHFDNDLVFDTFCEVNGFVQQLSLREGEAGEQYIEEDFNSRLSSLRADSVLVHTYDEEVDDDEESENQVDAELSSTAGIEPEFGT